MAGFGFTGFVLNEMSLRLSMSQISDKGFAPSDGNRIGGALIFECSRKDADWFDGIITNGTYWASCISHV